MPSLKKIALRFRFLGGPSASIMKATIVKSVVELVSVFNGEQEVSLLSYDGSSPFNRQGADLGNAQND